LSVEENTQNNGVKLKDICKIHVGITTLADAVFIMKFIKIENELIYLQAKNGEIIIVEKAITKPIIKASKLKKSDEEITEYIIFPYDKEANKTKVIAEAVLQEKYPLAYQYLLSVKDILDKRDNGKPNKAAWYAFGRSQGLETSFGKKILFSPMNSQPNFIYSENEEATFYSGYCIKYNGDYQWLLSKLNSEHLAAFMARSSRDFRGGWKAYNKTVLEQYVLPE
jgi:hypothetical protein